MGISYARLRNTDVRTFTEKSSYRAHPYAGIHQIKVCCQQQPGYKTIHEHGSFKIDAPLRRWGVYHGWLTWIPRKHYGLIRLSIQNKICVKLLTTPKYKKHLAFANCITIQVSAAESGYMKISSIMVNGFVHWFLKFSYTVIPRCTAWIVITPHFKDINLCINRVWSIPSMKL